ncbi:hypothetical protein LDENG_00268850 [Lucifuga dentata]|nr:hypothetical protein LDENG_00268850 [Lucifuga dentata]
MLSQSFRMDHVVASTEGEGFLSRMALNDNKAGMDGLDREKINKIIMESSKGSRFYENELKKEQQVNQRIEKMMLQKEQITEQQLKKAHAQVKMMTSDLERSRDLSRVIVHVDMDAFYAAVEMRDCPELKDKPMAVGSNSMLSTSNYNARKFGVRAAMPGFIAKKLCPKLIIVPTNFDKYKAVSYEIREIFADYDPHFQPLSLDEAYLDFTEHLKQRKNWPESLRTHCFCTSSTATGEAHSEPPQDIEEKDLSPVLFEDSPSSSPCRLASGGSGAAGGRFEVFGTSVEEAVREMRFRIEQKTMLTASAGIAPNMMLAKVCSDKNKPNGQYQLPSTREAIMDFIQNLPIRKVFGIGKVSEKMLNALGIRSCSDLGQQMAMLSLLFSETACNHFLRVSMGLGATYIPRNEERKSMSTERTFKELSQAEKQLSFCKELCEDLAEDMKKEGLRGKTVTLKLKNVNFEVKTRASTLPYAVATADEIFAVAKDLLKTEIENESPQPLRLRLMGVRVSAFVSSDDKEPLQKSILGFLQPGKTDPCGSLQASYQTLSNRSIQNLPAICLPPAQMSLREEEVPRLTEKSDPGQISVEHQQSFFQRARERLQLQVEKASKQEEGHGQNACESTSTGTRAEKSGESSTKKHKSKSDFTVSCRTSVLTENDCKSTSGLGDTDSQSLTCPVCFRQVETTDLSVFNTHVDHCLSDVSRKPNQSTDTDSKSDVDQQNDHQEWQVRDNEREEFKVKEEKERKNDAGQSPLDPDRGLVLVCPVCQVAQDTGDLMIFNHHVDVCLNQEVLHELEGQTSSLINPPSITVTNLKVAEIDHRLPRQVQIKAKKGKSKTRDSPSSPPPSKKAKGLGHNTIDKFFR